MLIVSDLRKTGPNNPTLNALFRDDILRPNNKRSTTIQTGYKCQTVKDEMTTAGPIQSGGHQETGGKTMKRPSS